MVQAQPKAVGVDANITIFDSSVISDEYNTGAPQLALRPYDWDNADIIDGVFSVDCPGYLNVSMFNRPKAEDLHKAVITGSKKHDYPVVQAGLLMLAMAVMLGTLVAIFCKPRWTRACGRC